MTNFEIAKDIITANIESATCGIFNVRNIVGDPMVCLHDDKNGLRVDICYYYSYFEVFGLTPDEFYELEKYYNKLKNELYDKWAHEYEE